MPNGICAPLCPKGALPHAEAPHGVSALGQGTVPAGFGGLQGRQEGGRQELHRSQGKTRCGAGQKRGVGLSEKDMERG